jgi:ribosomal protein S18 acetylase RimI-like enzyme
MMPDMDVLVRPAALADRAGELLYESARPYYDAFAGSEERAQALLEGLWERGGHTASWEICAVATAGEELVGVLAGYPVSAGDRLARRFLRLAIPRLPARQWPGVWRHLRAAGRLAPLPPARAFYVDALAVAPTRRRQGVAAALLEDATERARAAGLSGIALDTGLDNTPAQALYEHAGFESREVRRVASEAMARAVGGRGFVAYYRGL